MRRPVSTPSATEERTLRIEAVGGEGDGVATLPDGAKCYAPLTLPGELVRMPLVMVGAGPPSTSWQLLESSPDRIAPPCAHFGDCGGCTLQHWRGESYAAWKADLLRDALRRAGYADPLIAPLATAAPAERRRMDLAAQRTPAGIMLGLHRRNSHAVVDLAECHVLHPTLFALLAPLRHMLTRTQGLRRGASVIANLLDDGIDLLLRTDADLAREDRTRLIEFARAHRLLRLCWAHAKDEPEPVIVLRPPCIAFAGVVVEPPPGGFLQATARGEAAIAQAVLAGLPSRLPARARVAELYAGSGSLSFALAPRVRVAAWEGDAAAVAALRRAANGAGLAGRVDVMQRDLGRQPLQATELAGFAAVVLDPPHAGAATQMPTIAAARPGQVIYVSCNPAALARDARVLHGAGYRVLAATPIDQFLWSARLESVVVFGFEGAE